MNKFSTSAESEERCITRLQENVTPDKANGLVMCVGQCLAVRTHNESERELSIQWK
jgi:hypothetical protein